MAWLKIVGFLALTIAGGALVAAMLYVATIAYIFSSAFGMDHLRYLNLPVAAEVAAEFSLGLLMLVFGVRGLWRTMIRWRRDRKAQTQSASTPQMMMGSIGGASEGEPERPPYAVGQVWQYHTRPSDPDSLLKIQVIENDPAFAEIGPIFHISIIAVHLGRDRRPNEVGHAPVSKEALDESVTTLVKSDAPFPDVAPGIEDWSNEKGGVFTLTVAEIVDVIDETIRDPST